MQIFFLVSIFFFGLIIGSFLNVLIDRLPRGESPFQGRSHCEYCNHILSWYDLFPVFSFILLQGRCRYCKKFIGWRYLIIELTTGLLFTLTLLYLPEGIKYQVSPKGISALGAALSIKYLLSAFYYLFIISSLVVIFFTDLFYGIIPDAIILPASVIAFLYILFTSFFSLPFFLLSALGAFFFFFFLFAFTKGKGMGFGDVKLAFFMGLVLGWPKIFLSIYTAFLTGAFIALILIIWKKKHFKKSTIPFGPFLVLGTLINLFFGNFLLQKLIHLYF